MNKLTAIITLRDRSRATVSVSVLLAATWFTPNPAGAQNLILNGSFEAPAIAANTYQRINPTGWSWGATMAFVYNGGGLRGPLPQDGNQAIDLGNSPEYTLSQTFNITSNALYLLSWFDASIGVSGPYSVAVLDASSQTIVSNNFIPGSDWDERKLLIYLSAGTNRLRFTAGGNGNSADQLIDNVVLEQRPGKVVSGTIVTQVWTAANSPYLVVDHIQVAGLTIQPGVTVHFASNYVFEVAGKLKAIGTPDLPILFTANSAGWQGIFFNAAQPGCELAHCIIEKSVNTGIRIVNTPVSISDCIIRGNGMTMDVWQSGTVSIELNGAGIKTDSSLVLDNCTIQNNSSIVRVRANDASAIARGGGVYSTAPLKLLNCTISSNSLSAVAYLTGSGPGSAYCEGGGVWAGTNLTVQNCLITANSVNADCTSVGGPSLTSSLGGGILSQGPLLQRNSIIAGNTAAGDAGFGRELKLKGGGAYIRGKLSSIENCTIAFNNPDGLATDSNGTQVINSIVWGNVTNQIVGTTNVTYSDVQGGMAGLGNISGSPIFLSSSDLIIVPGSPCINRGSTNAAYTNIYFPPSIGRGRSDMGAHGGPGAGARLRARFSQQLEVVFLGGVPGYNYQIQASTDLSNWQTVEQVQIAHIGDYASFLEPITNAIPFRFYRLNLGP